MMAVAEIRPDWTIGTLNLTAGSVEFTTNDSLLQTAAIQPGDEIITASGLILIIASITDQNAGTLMEPCPADAAGSGQPLRIRFQPDGSRYNGAAADLVQRLSSGNVYSLSGLDGSAGGVPVFTGPGTMEVVPESEIGVPDPNGTLGELAKLDSVENLSELAELNLEANKVLTTSDNGELTQSDITTAARAMLASDSPVLTDLGYTPINKAGDLGISGDLKTTGKVYVGSSLPASSPNIGTPALQAQGVAGSHSAALFYYPDSTAIILSLYRQGAGEAGAIRGDGGTGVLYTSTSDYRLKYDVEPLVTFTIDAEDFNLMGPALLRVLAMRPVRHKWVDGPDEYIHGFIAHELQAPAPHAVTGFKDETAVVGVARDEDGNIVAENIERSQVPEGCDWVPSGSVPVFQQVDTSRLIADLTAAVQELTVIVLEQQKKINKIAELSALEWPES